MIAARSVKKEDNKILKKDMLGNINKEIGNNKHNNTSTFHIIRFEERLRRYREARARIFNDLGCDIMRVVYTRSNSKVRVRFKLRAF